MVFLEIKNNYMLFVNKVLDSKIVDHNAKGLDKLNAIEICNKISNPC